MFKLVASASAAVLLLGADAAVAQSSSSQDRLNQILGAVLGQASSLDGQWLRGARPLANGQAQFEARLESDVRARALTRSAAERLRSEYRELVALEARYGNDRRFSSQERAELNERYTALTRSLDEGGPSGSPASGGAAAEQSAFDARVNAALSSRRISRTEASRLRAEYEEVVQLEAEYQRGGLTMRERSELDERLDALDARLGDGPSAATTPASARTRLAAIATALRDSERSGAVSRSLADSLRTQHGDLTRLEAAYARARPTADDEAYLDRRIGELETELRMGRR